MPKIELVHWNPRRRVFKGRITRRIPISGRRVQNFGDLLGPRIVNELLRRKMLSNESAAANRRLVSIGSVMHLARDTDVIWGSGINGKHMHEQLPFSQVDIRAVRGHLTRELLQKQGHFVPDVLGDPGLLVGELWPFMKRCETRYPLTVIPNLNDLRDYKESQEVLDPRSDLKTCLTRIAESEFVVGSSLHGIIVAESLGVPARLISSSVEPSFKYEDYYLGSGRNGFRTAKSVNQALDLGGESALKWDSGPLLDSFPFDLWGAELGNPLTTSDRKTRASVTATQQQTKTND